MLTGSTRETNSRSHRLRFATNRLDAVWSFLVWDTAMMTRMLPEEEKGETLFYSHRAAN